MQLFYQVVLSLSNANTLNRRIFFLSRKKKRERVYDGTEDIFKTRTRPARRQDFVFFQDGDIAAEEEGSLKNQSGK